MRGLAVLVPAAMAAAPASADALRRNPRDRVAVRTGACGGRLRGWVLWPNADASAGMRDPGWGALTGTAPSQDDQPVDRGRWKGTVYVPEMGHGFSSEIDPLQRKVKDCVSCRLTCKSQNHERPRG